jgi:hypothetical protein
MLNITFMGFQIDMKKIYFNKFIVHVSVYKYLIPPLLGELFCGGKDKKRSHGRQNGG